MFIKFNDKLINTALVTKFEKDVRQKEYVIDAIYVNGFGDNVHYDTEKFKDIGARDERFYQLERTV